MDPILEDGGIVVGTSRSTNPSLIGWGSLALPNPYSKLFPYLFLSFSIKLSLRPSLVSRLPALDHGATLLHVPVDGEPVGLRPRFKASKGTLLIRILFQGCSWSHGLWRVLLAWLQTNQDRSCVSSLVVATIMNAMAALQQQN